MAKRKKRSGSRKRAGVKEAPAAEKKAKKPENRAEKKAAGKKEGAPSSLFADRRFLYSAIVVVILLAVTWRAGVMLSENSVVTPTGLAVENGDQVSVQYVGTLEDGTEFDSGEIEFTAGAGQMIQGFDAAVVGMKAGDEKTVTIPPEQAYGARDPSRVLPIPREQEINKTFEMSVTEFTGIFQEEAQTGSIYSTDQAQWSYLAVGKTNDTVTLQHLPEDGQIVQTAYGPATVSVGADLITIVFDPELGASIMTPYGQANISEVSDTELKLDFNHPLAGKSLTFKITVMNVTRLSAFEQACGQIDVVKAEKPRMEAFVMSYCPYGLQMMKGMLPVMKLLGDKADIDVRFVNYIMHDKKEIDENTRMHCIQTEQGDKLIGYLECFLGSGNTDECLVEAGVDASALDACVAAADEEFQITELYEDKSTWSNGRFPLYKVHDEENKLYGVGGSPTVVVNGAKVQTSRSPEGVKNTICCAFNDPPPECDETLSDANPSPGFGWGEEMSGGSGGTCG